MNSSGTAYVETGGKEPVEVQLFDRVRGEPLLSKTDIKVRIRRHNDDLYYDWSDNTFKAYNSVVLLLQPLSIVNDTRSPGLYRLSTVEHLRGFDTGLITNLLGNDVLEFTVVQDGGHDAAGLPTGFELKVGNFLDTILRVVALQKENYYIDQIVYNTPGLMTSARIRLFHSKNDVLAATDGGAGEGEFAIYSFNSVPSSVHAERAVEVRSVKD